MSEDLTLPIIAAGVLLWYLVCALRQWRTEASIEPEPTVVWREAGVGGWSDWYELTAVDPSADYDGVLSTVRANANPGATAVQFATVVQPAGAPAYTLRVLFMSAVREAREPILAVATVTMAEILIAALSPVGHVSPLLAVAQDLVARGDRVTVMTGAVHSDTVHAIGAQPHPLPAIADFDDSAFDASDRGKTSAIKALNRGIIRLFLNPMPHQAAELAAAMARTHFDAIIVDFGFFGIIPLLLGDPANRPPVLYYTPTPLMLSSRDTAPNGMGLPPGVGRWGRLRNRALNLFAHNVILREAHRAANAMLAALGARRLPVFLLDIGVLAERYIVPTVPSFEYPRSDLAPNVRFVGAVHPQSARRYVPPRWWKRLDDDRPVVARHPGHRRSRRPVPAHRADHRGARRRGRHGRGDDGRPQRRRHQGGVALEYSRRRIHSVRRPACPRST